MKKLLQSCKFIRSIGFVTALLVGTLVNAEELNSERFYVGFGLSESNLNVNNGNTIAVNGLEEQSVLKDDGFGLSAFAGFKLDEHLSFELGYSELGSVQLTDSAGENNFLDVQSIYLDAILSHQVMKNVDAFALVGVAGWELIGSNGEKVSDGNDLRYGAGVDINIYGNDNRVMRIKWEHQEFDDLILSDSDTVSVSIIFKF